MRRAMLTVTDVGSIVDGNFVPDVKKLASEIEANVDDPVTLRAVGARIIADYGQKGLQKVMDHINTIHAAVDIERAAQHVIAEAESAASAIGMGLARLRRLVDG